MAQWYGYVTVIAMIVDWIAIHGVMELVAKAKHGVEFCYFKHKGSKIRQKVGNGVF